MCLSSVSTWSWCCWADFLATGELMWLSSISTWSWSSSWKSLVVLGWLLSNKWADVLIKYTEQKKILSRYVWIIGFIEIVSLRLNLLCLHDKTRWNKTQIWWRARLNSYILKVPSNYKKERKITPADLWLHQQSAHQLMRFHKTWMRSFLSKVCSYAMQVQK